MHTYLPQIIASVIVLILWPMLRYVAKKFVARYGKMIHMPEPRVLQVGRVISILIGVILIFALAIIWGVDPKNILLGLSSVFAVIGVAMFAQWSVLSNITAGLIMFFSAPFQVGDRIHLLDKDMPIVATIESIQTFYTHLRTDDQELIVLPNNLFLQKMVSVKRR